MADYSKLKNEELIVALKTKDVEINQLNNSIVGLNDMNRDLINSNERLQSTFNSKDKEIVDLNDQLDESAQELNELITPKGVIAITHELTQEQKQELCKIARTTPEGMSAICAFKYGK